MAKLRLRKRRKRGYDAKTARRIVALYIQLRSLQKVGKEIGMTAPGVIYYLERFGITRQPKGRGSYLRDAFFEELATKYDLQAYYVPMKKRGRGNLATPKENEEGL